LAVFRRLFIVVLAALFGFSVGVFASPAFSDRITQVIQEDFRQALANGIRDGLAEGVSQLGEHVAWGEFPVSRKPFTEGTSEGASQEVLSPVSADAAAFFTALERSMTPKEREEFLRWAQAKLTPELLDVLVKLWTDRDTFARMVELTSRFRGTLAGEDILYLFDLLGRLEAKEGAAGDKTPAGGSSSKSNAPSPSGDAKKSDAAGKSGESSSPPSH